MGRSSPQEASSQSPKRVLRLLVWGLVSALLPMLVAFVVVLSPVIETTSSSEAIESTPFVLDPIRGEGIPDSLRADIERERRVQTLLRSEEAYLLARQSEVRSSQPMLWLDMHDSLAVLAVQGVPIRTSRMHRIERSASFERRSTPDELIREFESCARLVGSWATIPRIPMRIVQAPKDTAEARLRPPDAFLAEEQNVYAELRFDRNIALLLVPSDEPNNWLTKFRRSAAWRMRVVRETIHLFFTDSTATPPRWIRLEMRSDDIRAIYRAVPDGGALAIRW